MLSLSDYIPIKHVAITGHPCSDQAAMDEAPFTRAFASRHPRSIAAENVNRLRHLVGDEITPRVVANWLPIARSGNHFGVTQDRSGSGEPKVRQAEPNCPLLRHLDGLRSEEHTSELQSQSN